jgi:isoquinoline 1-oxidoreductase subunit beta
MGAARAMNDDVARRDVLRAALGAAGGLVLGFFVPAKATAEDPSPPRFAPNAWLRIGTDNSVTILVEKPEMGNGARTYTPILIAEELEVDWRNIRIEQAPTLPAIYQNLRTAGSGGVESIFIPMRRAGAQARMMLVTAAARGWGAVVADCVALDGHVVHRPTGRRLAYGDLACAAASVPPIDPALVKLKDPRDFRIIGKGMPRTDAPSKVRGEAIFGIDVRVPGMLFAVIARCPYFGGTLASFDATAAKGMPGVRSVFRVPPLPRRFNTAGGVAVVAETSWAAIEARKALVLTWEKPKGMLEDSGSLRERMKASADRVESYVVIDRGNTSGALAAATVIEAAYESPFQAHAPMEPMNTVVHVREDAIEVWSPTQFADEIQSEVAELSGRKPRDVIVHMTLSGGSFGRRYQWDYAAEAWQVAKEMSVPVQLLWTREDDIQHDFYRPHNYQKLRGALDNAGNILAWETRIVTTPIVGTNVYTGMDDSPKALNDPATVATLEWYGADVAPYTVGNFRLAYVAVNSPVPRSWWRGVASSYTPFAKECFVDELAHTAGIDPLQFRLNALSDGKADTMRVRHVLELVARHTDWGTPLPRGQGRGIAQRAGETCIAMVAEVAVADNGEITVKRMVCAVDCGIAVNPDGVRQMIEGGINFGLTAVLHAEITIRDGAVEQSNFHDYRVLRMDEAPPIEVFIVPSGAPPSGVGEAGAMITAPTVANAVFAATGGRLRRLPLVRVQRI